MTATNKKLPAWVILLMILGALVLLGIVGVVALSAYVYRNRDRLVEEGARAFEKAERYGANHSQAECGEQGFVELDKCAGFKCTLSASLFVTECMRGARPSPEYCADVPPPGSLKLGLWSVAECNRRNRGIQNQACQQVEMAIAQGCHAPRGAASTAR